MDPTLPGRLETIPSHLGEISVRLVGENENDRIPVVCLPGFNPALVDEWVEAAVKLSENGFRVCIINFRSNPRTVPALLFGGISDADVGTLIAEAILRDYFKVKKAVVMGKSWGGRQAALFAGRYPHQVLHLCLVAPASSDPAMIQALIFGHISAAETSEAPSEGSPPAATEETQAQQQQQPFQVFLAWALDDMLVWHSNTETWRAILKDRLCLYTAEKGGHLILSEYTTPLLEFLKAGCS